MSETNSESLFTIHSPGEQLSRRERKKERTRQEIYRAAMELFIARGYDAVTVEDICDTADVAKGTFFLHFPTKDALLLEYGVQVTQELDALLRSHRNGATAALQKILTFLTERATQHAAVVQLLAHEVMMHPSAFVEVTRQGRNLGHLFADIVRQGQSAGEFRRTIEPRLAAALITSAYFAILNDWGRSGGKFALTAALQQTLDIVLNGLAEKQDGGPAQVRRISRSKKLQT